MSVQNICTRHYGLFPQSWQKINANNRNSINYIVKTAHDTFLLRHYLVLNDRKNLLRIFRLLDHCARQNILVPVCIMTKDKYYFVEYEGSVYALFKFIPGKEFSGSLSEIGESGRSIAQLHKALAQYAGELPEQNNAMYDILTEGELEEVETKAVEQNMVTILRHITKIKQILQQHSLPGNLPQQPIHRDLHPANMVFQEENTPAIIDFDAVTRGERVRDVAFAAFRHAILQGTDSLVVRKKINAFLQAYQAGNPLMEEEKKALPLFIRDEALRRISYILREFLNGKVTWLDDLEKHLKHIMLSEKIFG